MAKQHKIHRTASWQWDLNLLICIFRLRIQPPVPYFLIASVSEQHLPHTVTKLLAKSINGSEHQNVNSWLEKYFADTYEEMESSETKIWKQARQWDRDVVIQILQILELGGRFKVMSNTELELQIRWRKEGDWRAGSEQIARQKISQVHQTKPYAGGWKPKEMPFGGRESGLISELPEDIKKALYRGWRKVYEVNRRTGESLQDSGKPIVYGQSLATSQHSPAPGYAAAEYPKSFQILDRTKNDEFAHLTAETIAYGHDMLLAKAYRSLRQQCKEEVSGALELRYFEPADCSNKDCIEK